jgi:RimJ/RimL family protein N-acetyltransferase
LSDSDQPVGPPVDATPAQKPGDVRLEGRFGAVEKLDALRHGSDLWHAVKDNDRIWTYLNYGPWTDPREFTNWLTERGSLEDPYSYAIVDPEGRALGIATLMEIRPAMKVIEVGNIFFGTPLQRTPLATEAQYLLARYAFETLGYRRYEWKCDSLNAASRRAALRFGFTFEGIFRQHMIRHGRNRDTAWFSIIDGEWPARRATFETWLAPANFDEQGRQKVSLASLQKTDQPR